MTSKVEWNNLHRARSDLKKILSGELEFKKVFRFDSEEWREITEYVAEKVQREIMRDYYYEDRNIRRDIRPFPDFDQWLEQYTKKEN